VTSVLIRTYPTCGICGHKREHHETPGMECIYRYGPDGPFCQCDHWEGRFRAHTDEELVPLEAPVVIEESDAH
jgi:hypothetical protein